MTPLPFSTWLCNPINTSVTSTTPYKLPLCIPNGQIQLRLNLPFGKLPKYLDYTLEKGPVQMVCAKEIVKFCVITDINLIVFGIYNPYIYMLNTTNFQIDWYKWIYSMSI